MNEVGEEHGAELDWEKMHSRGKEDAKSKFTRIGKWFQGGVLLNQIKLLS